MDFEEKRFKCKEMTGLPSRLCIFHDSGYLQVNNLIHRTDVLNKLKQKINQDILQYKKVECLGYYIPDIKFSRFINETSSMIIEKNKVDFYFEHATFLGVADFSSAFFSGVTDFSSATFSREADFSHATFSEKVSFSSTDFLKRSRFLPCYFLRSLFSPCYFFRRSKILQCYFLKRSRFLPCYFLRKSIIPQCYFLKRSRFLPCYFLRRRFQLMLTSHKQNLTIRYFQSKLNSLQQNSEI